MYGKDNKLTYDFRADFWFALRENAHKSKRICSAFALCNLKIRLLKFSDLTLVHFRVVFGAAEDARLSPCYDNKPKSAENAQCKAYVRSLPLP